MPKHPKQTKRGRSRPSAVPIADRELREQLTQAHAFEALSLMRTRQLSLRQAAREVDESPAAVVRRIGPALRKDRRGRYVARASDHLVREMEILTRDGKAIVKVRGSKTASLVGSHWNAVKDFLENRPTALRQFRGQEIRTGRSVHHLLTDPRRLHRLASAGEVSFESIYPLTR
jgi:hypothetical protein